MVEMAREKKKSEGIEAGWGNGDANSIHTLFSERLTLSVSRSMRNSRSNLLSLLVF